jgi:hypothetical protein
MFMLKTSRPLKSLSIFIPKSKSVTNTALKQESWQVDWEICVSALNLSCLRLKFQSCTRCRKTSLVKSVSFSPHFWQRAGCVSQTGRAQLLPPPSGAFRKAACARPVLSTYALLNARSVSGTLWPICLDGRRWTASMQPHLGCRSFTPRTRRVLNLRECLSVWLLRVHTHTGCAIVL